MAKDAESIRGPSPFHAACKGHHTKLAGGNMPAFPDPIPRRFGNKDELEPEDFRSGKARNDRQPRNRARPEKGQRNTCRSTGG
jgi:hypothetical protein